MIGSASNAFPNGNTIDAETQRDKFSITYYGDHCDLVRFIAYDYHTKQYTDNTEWGSIASLGCDNGDIIPGYVYGIEQNKEYIWKARFYQNVDLENGIYPTIYSRRGKIKNVPIIGAGAADASLTDWLRGRSGYYFMIHNYVNLKPPFYMCSPKFPSEGSKVVAAIDAMSGGYLVYSPEKYPTVFTEGDVVYFSKNKIGISDILDIPPHIENTSFVYIDPGLELEARQTRPDYGGTCYLKHNGNYYKIIEYNNSIGRARVEGNPSVSVGDSYEIYYDFKDSPYYYFKTKPTPKVSVTASINSLSSTISCAAKIQDAELYQVKYCQWHIYNENDVEIEKSKKVYSAYGLNYVTHNAIINKSYKVQIVLVTQDNIEVISEKVTVEPYEDFINFDLGLRAEEAHEKNAVKLTWNSVKFSTYSIYRENLNTKETIRILSIAEKRLGGGIGADSHEDDPETYICDEVNTFYDYTCKSGVSYEYTVVATSPIFDVYASPYPGRSAYNPSSVKITPEFQDWQIVFLDLVNMSAEFEEYAGNSVSQIERKENLYDYTTFSILSETEHIWKAQIDLNTDEIKQNFERKDNVTNNGLPIVTCGNYFYDTFSCEFLLGEYNCEKHGFEKNTVESLENWLNDVKSGKTVMVKSHQGNIWFGSITGHSYSLSYTNGSEKFYKIKFDFVQEYEANNVIVVTSKAELSAAMWM